MHIDTETGFVPPWGFDMPVLTYFYGGELTRQRVNREADRLVAFANHQRHLGKATDTEFRVWRAGLEVWRQHWYGECSL